MIKFLFSYEFLYEKIRFGQSWLNSFFTNETDDEFIIDKNGEIPPK